ncbi:MAG: DUF2225 domain-containing protein [Dehalococcoidia bacterium]|nr:MAG: DUF2225 domain-containing protein [Dehalococcoidia bacterium]
MAAEAEGLNRLTRFAQRVPDGALIYDQGEVPRRIVVVLRGHLQFEVVGEDGVVTVVGGAGAGQMAGHIAAVNARPTSAAARASEETILLSIPLGSLAEAFKDAPGLAVQLAEALEAADRIGKSHTSNDAQRRAARDAVTIPVPAGVDEQTFFVDIADCPICDSAFEYVRIRTRGVRPAHRDSDLRVSYNGVDPTWYAVVVCPQCSFASYRDDFDAVTPGEHDRLVATTADRRAISAKAMTGARSAQDAEIALELAMRSYALRQPNERRQAVLLHRRAWLARAADDTVREMEWLERARDAYQSAYERDPEVDEDSALRAAYLIGDLTLRLGDPRAAGRWFEVCTKAGASEQSGLVRMARERLHDAREAAKAQADVAKAS